METFGRFRPTAFDARGLGADTREDWLVVGVSQTRDSGPLDASNFACALREIGNVAREWDYDGPGEDAGDYSVERFGHWGPGWFEIIVVRPNTDAARVAQEITDALEDYPILDEDDFSRREWDAAQETWARCYNLKERVALCQEAGVSIFAARHDSIPQDDDGSIYQALVRA